MSIAPISGSADLSLPGFKTRHQVELQATDWAGVLDLLGWIDGEAGQVAYLRTTTTLDGCIRVAIGIEAMNGDRLRTEMLAFNSVTSLRIEHLFVREKER